VDPVIAFYLLEITEYGLDPAYFVHTGMFILRSLILQKKHDVCLRLLYDIVPTLLLANLTALFAPPGGPANTFAAAKDYFAKPLAHGSFDFSRDIILVLLSLIHDQTEALTLPIFSFPATSGPD